MSSKVRIGIIGTGGMAAAHVEQYNKTGEVDIVTCYDVAAEKAKAFATKHEITSVANDIADLVEQVDAVSIVTPDRFHAELAILFLSQGKHVLCEKPLTVTLDEAGKVAAAAKEAAARGTINMVNFSYRSSAAFQKAMSIARSGQLGQIRHVQSFYLQQWLNGSGIDTSKTSTDSLWRLATSLGSAGVLGDLGCHILDLTSACSEDFVAMRCELRTFPKLVDGYYSTNAGSLALDANDTALIEFELAGGGVGVCHTTRWATGHGNHLRFEVYGTEGAVTFDLAKDPNSIELCFGKDRLERPWENTYVSEKLEPTPSNWARFVTAIKTGNQESPDIARGAVVQSYLDTCERSAKSGVWERVVSVAGQ